MIKLIMIAILLTLAGCNSDKPKNKNQNVEPANKVVYDGLRQGCIANWDKLFCPDNLKDGTLSAGADDNRTIIYLDDNAMQKLIDMKNQPKVWKE